MNTRNKTEGHGISLVDAVETLSMIADSEPDIQPEDLKRRVVAQGHHGGVSVNLLREIFKTILDHLKSFYREEVQLEDERSVEGIKTIMLLVGEAAKKLNNLTFLFHKTRDKAVNDLREYKQLQEFYQTRIARVVDDVTLSRWIFGLSQRAFGIPEISQPQNHQEQVRHVFIDLEGVKKDTEYELFFIRKEDGTRFFSPRLVRNIKLVSDFGKYFNNAKTDDPIADLRLLQDRCIHTCAKNIIHTVEPVARHFFRLTTGNQDNSLVFALRKACMALMLASSSQNLLKNDPSKSCLGYFEDFQEFLREIFKTHEYQNLMAYAPIRINEVNQVCLDLIHSLCSAFFLSMQGFHDAVPFIQNLVQESLQGFSPEQTALLKKDRSLHNRMNLEYEAMGKLMKRHPNGSLEKIMESIEDGAYRAFDPLLQSNLPAELFNIYAGELKIVDLRIPSPTRQEMIQKAHITDEFKAFLQGLETNLSANKLLIFNFQDRTSWREHARCAVLEDLQHQDSIQKNCTVVTIPKDTEFYHQQMPYSLENHADLFISSFKEQLVDESAGFYFSEAIHASLDAFIEGAMDAVHRIFFNSKNVLLKEQRLDFIEIFYFFLELKLIDVVKPDLISFTCKDAVDNSGAANAQLFAFLKLLNQERLSESDMELLDLLLYVSPLTIRERLMNPERFKRMLTALKALETTRELLGTDNFRKVVQESFSHFYTIPFFDAKVLPVKVSQEIY